MSASQPLAVSRRGRDEQPLAASCTARVLLLIDIAGLPAAAERGKGGISSSRNAATVVDGLRLSILRVLTQLCLSCPANSWVEWAPRFFDSRPCGVGKTPAELRARLRSRQAAQGVRGFPRVTQSSFRAFGDACLAMACGTYGDPLARDRDTALRRWAHGQKKQPPTWRRQHRSDPAGAADGRSAQAERGDSKEDVCGRMYDGHDMSSQEVVVRSLLEVLQDFDEASEGDRTAIPSISRSSSGNENQKLQLVLLHSAFLRTDEDAERFALHGNFTTEAAAINELEQQDEKILALDGLLGAHLGKAIRRAGSRGVSFSWQDGVPLGNPGSRGDESESVGQNRRETCLHRCLSAVGGASVLRWERVVGSTGLLPPSAALGPQFAHRGVQCRAMEAGETDERLGDATVVAVALNPQGDVDVHLLASPMSDPVDSFGCHGGDVADGGASSHTGARSALHATPWRLMGTLPLGEVWPSCLAGQGWGATRLLRANGGRGAQLWRKCLGELVAQELAGVISLPQRLFGCQAPPTNGNLEQDQEARVSDALTVALLLPVSGDCAVCFSARGLAATPTAGQESVSRRSEFSGGVSSSSAQKSDGPGVPVTSGGSIAADRSDEGLMRAEWTLKARGTELGLAMHEASLARKRRRQSKLVPVKGARGVDNPGSLIAGVEFRGLGSGGGQSGSLSQRDSGSLCFTAEGASGDGAGYDVRQWRLETASATSHGSASPRGYRLFGGSTPSGGAEDDEQMSSTGSSSGPKRALHQALEDASSRSSLLELADADSSSTPGSKDEAGWRTRATASFAVPRNRGPAESVLSPSAETAGDDEADFSAVVGGNSGATELPLSFMSEPALACLPGPALPADLLALADRCALRNSRTATKASAAAAATAAATITAGGGVYCGTHGGTPEPRRAGLQQGGARQRFLESVRSLKRRRQAAGSAATPDAAADARDEGGSEIVPDVGREEEPPEPTAQEIDAGAQLPTLGGKQGDSAEVVEATDSEGRLPSFEDIVGKGVVGLQMQYREVVEGGKRSPVEFVVCAVPEAIRDMTDGGVDASSVDHSTDDQQARAAQVLAAVVSGLTATPQDLSSKHRANRSAAGASGGAGAVGVTASAVPAKPALQKIRDYQLQALLLCQLNSLAMDLPETPNSLVAFCSLAKNEATEDAKSKKKRGKGKGKKRKRGRKGDGDDKIDIPTRPSDPLPDCRRTRLVDYLQPISTMLDACTVTKAPPPDDSGGGASGAGDGAACSKSKKGFQKGFQSRAYDGTLADFMGLALVEHFAPRLARTLGALFEDFECHLPDSLTAALAGASTSDSGAAVGGSVGPVSDGGQDFPKGAGGRAGAAPAAAAAAATAVELHTGIAQTGDAAGASSRASSTAGILLSDRTAMSHNHFKMSGVLNGFREVTLKAPTASGGLGPSVLSSVSGNGQGGGDVHARGAGSGQSGGWRTSNGGGGGRRGVRSRATRDSKQATGTGSGKGAQLPGPKPSPAVGIRQSPRLNRTHPRGDADADADDGGVLGTAHKNAAGSKRPLPLAWTAGTSTGSSTPARQRRRVSASRGGVPAGGGGLLVGETPQKRRGLDAAAGTSRTSSRCGGRASRVDDNDNDNDNDNDDDDVHAAAGTAPSRQCSRMTKTLVSGEANVPASPGLPMGSPAAAAGAAPGPAKRRRGTAIAPASPAEALFVAESPGISTGSAPRNGRIAWGLGGDGGGISRHLMAESASPVARGRAGGVVPDTPA